MKIISRGNVFELDDSIFEPGQHTMIFGPNGSGKTGLSSAFLHEKDNDFFRIEDLTGEKSADISELEKIKNNRNFVELNTSSFKKISRRNNEIVISKNALDIQKYTKEFQEYTQNINLATSKIRKEFAENGITTTIFKKYFKSRVSFESGINYKTFLNWPDEELSNISGIKKYYFTEKDIRSARKIIEEIDEYFKEFKNSVVSKVSLNLFSKKINPSTLQHYEKFLALLNNNKKVFSLENECPFCGGACDYDNLIKELNKAIKESKQDGGDYFNNLQSAFDHSPAPDMDILWFDDGMNYPLDITIEAFDKKFDGIRDNDYQKMLQMVSPTLKKVVQISKKLDILEKAAPVITKNFYNKFTTMISQLYNLNDLQLELKVENKEIIITSKGQILNSGVLSSSMLTLFCFCYEYAYLKTLTNPIIIVDDPTDSNDIKNIRFLKDKLVELCTEKNTVIIFTHDIQLIKELENE